MSRRYLARSATAPPDEPPPLAAPGSRSPEQESPSAEWPSDVRLQPPPAREAPGRAQSDRPAQGQPAVACLGQVACRQARPRQDPRRGRDWERIRCGPKDEARRVATYATQLFKSTERTPPARSHPSCFALARRKREWQSAPGWPLYAQGQHPRVLRPFAAGAAASSTRILSTLRRLTAGPGLC